jgi:hypothetical protein
MTWKVFEQTHKRYRKLRRRLSDKALADLERRGFAVRDKSMAEIKAQIAAARQHRKEHA